MPKHQHTSLHWEDVGNGRLALWGRPSLKSLPALKSAGCDRVVTLLSEKEGASMIKQAVTQAHLAWTWFPLAGATPPAGEVREALLAQIDKLLAYLDQGESILIHCSAGIHRTGMVAYALLRQCGLSATAAKEVLAQLRLVTATGMHAEHYAWGDAIAAP